MGVTNSEKTDNMNERNISVEGYNHKSDDIIQLVKTVAEEGRRRRNR
jgi:hypothetical protein